MKVYVGNRSDAEDGSNVMVYESGKEPRPLALRLDVVNHSPTGFEWGYNGSGPAQLALAILLDFFGVKASEKDFYCLLLTRYPRIYQFFKDEVVAHFKTNKWALCEHEIKVWLEGNYGV
jgi:hypothetical protein